MKQITLNLLIIETRLDTQNQLLFPLQLPHIIRMNITAGQLASQVYKMLHEKLLRKGYYDTLLRYVVKEELFQEKLSVKFEMSKQQLFPDTELDFDLFYFQNENEQFVGFIPVLALESSGKTLEELKENATENIRLEFIRQRRLESVSSILTTQWFSESKMHSIPLEFNFYTLSEQENEQDREKQEILPHVSQRMEVRTQELFGLENEASQLMTALRSRTSVLVVADSGKGKTTLIKNFVNTKLSFGLADVSVWEVSAAQLLHRLSGFGGWEEHLAYLCNELRKKGDILYVQNFYELFEVGQYVGNNMSLADYLRDYVARGEIVLVSECTPEQLALMELRSPGYAALFSQVKAEEMTEAQICNIVLRKVRQIASRKQCKMDEEAVLEILRLQQWYTPYSGLPGKTIHFSENLLADKQKTEQKHIRKADIYDKFCQETGMPEFMLNPEISLDFEQMNRFFQDNIFGQADAIKTVTDILISIKAALIRRGKPLASLLFAGPTGVGKTEMAKVLAEFMFGNRGKMIRFDMSEYADYQSLMRLTGDMYSGEGLLTSAVRQEPFSVLLFDELEKVHPAFYDLLLQILGEGRLTDSQGKVADFCSTIIVMTSNLGASNFQQGSIGFSENGNIRHDATEHFTAEVQAFFRPELFNRLDRIIAFAPLEKEIIRQIVDREISLVQKREGLLGRNLKLTIDTPVADLLGKTGYNWLYGARFLQRTLQEKLIIPLSEQLNQYEFETPLKVEITEDSGEVVFKISRRTDLKPTEQALAGNENLTLAEFTTLVTQARRNAIKINNGNYYAKFLSRLDRLERKLESLKSKKQEHLFWNDLSQQKEYFLLSETKKDFAESLMEIQEIETDNFLLLNGLEVKTDTLYEKFSEWLSAFNRHKETLVAYENPEFMTCSFAIYGKAEELLELSDMYLHLAENRNFKVKPYQLWHTAEKVPENPDEDKFLVIRYEGDTFFRKPYHEKPDARYQLRGVEVEISGSLPFLYFKDENGLHIRLSADANQLKYQIRVKTEGLAKNPPPPIIHRQNFFQGKKARRTYQTKGFKDDFYNIQTTTPFHEKELAEILKNQFSKNVDGYLL